MHAAVRRGMLGLPILWTLVGEFFVENCMALVPSGRRFASVCCNCMSVRTDAHDDKLDLSIL